MAGLLAGMTGVAALGQTTPEAGTTPPAQAEPGAPEAGVQPPSGDGVRELMGQMREMMDRMGQMPGGGMGPMGGMGDMGPGGDMGRGGPRGEGDGPDGMAGVPNSAPLALSVYDT